MPAVGLVVCSSAPCTGMQGLILAEHRLAGVQNILLHDTEKVGGVNGDTSSNASGSEIIKRMASERVIAIFNIFQSFNIKRQPKASIPHPVHHV